MRDSSSASPARWSPARQLIFLVTLERTRSPAEAARAAGMSRESAYRYCQRHPGCLFDLAWRHLAARKVARGHCRPRAFVIPDLPPPPGRPKVTGSAVADRPLARRL